MVTCLLYTIFQLEKGNPLCYSMFTKRNAHGQISRQQPEPDMQIMRKLRFSREERELCEKGWAHAAENRTNRPAEGVFRSRTDESTDVLRSWMESERKDPAVETQKQAHLTSWAASKAQRYKLGDAIWRKRGYPMMLDIKNEQKWPLTAKNVSYRDRRSSSQGSFHAASGCWQLRDWKAGNNRYAIGPSRFVTTLHP